MKTIRRFIIALALTIVSSYIYSQRIVNGTTPLSIVQDYFSQSNKMRDEDSPDPTKITDLLQYEFIAVENGNVTNYNAYKKSIENIAREIENAKIRGDKFGYLWKITQVVKTIIDTNHSVIVCRALLKSSISGGDITEQKFIITFCLMRGNESWLIELLDSEPDTEQ